MTNNHLKSWNGAFNRRVNKNKPLFFYFINCLKNEQKRIEDLINSLSNGNPGPQKRTKYAQNDEKLKNLWLRLETNALQPIFSFEFLDKAAKCVKNL
jgi:hypothetical protein